MSYGPPSGRAGAGVLERPIWGHLASSVGMECVGHPDTERMSKVKSGSSQGSRAELQNAAREQSLVRLSRSIRRTDPLDGFVVALGQTWVLLAVLDHNIYLNGFAALRVADVKKVKRRG